MRWPWATTKSRTDGNQEPADSLTFGDADFAGSPDASWSGLALAAYRMYADVLAGAAPDDGPLTPELLSDCGWSLARRGEWLALIGIDEDGNATLTPCTGWPSRGAWTISTKERDGLDSRHLRVPPGMVFRVALERRPLDVLSSTSSIIGALEHNLARESIVPPSRLVAMGSENAAVSKASRDDIARGVSRGGVAVLPSGVASTGNVMRSGVQPSETALGLRAQMRIDVEAAFGLIGLLSHDNEQVALPWQLAVTRTFRPLAVRVEAEHVAKIGRRAGLRVERWDLETQAERSRGVMQRAQAAYRLQQAGMPIDAARQAAGV